MPAINTEQLIAALSDKRVVDALTKSIDELLSKKLASIENILKKREEDIEALQDENAALRSEMALQLTRIHELESYSRVDNLIVHGLPESYSSAATNAPDNTSQPGAENSAESEKLFIDFCQQRMKVNITASDVSVCHRLKKGKSDTCRPMIVRFTNRKARSAVLAARKSLRTTISSSTERHAPVFINEHLTNYTSKIFGTARQLVKTRKLNSAWTWNCKVFIKSNDGRISCVGAPSDLDKFM